MSLSVDTSYMCMLLLLLLKMLLCRIYKYNIRTEQCEHIDTDRCKHFIFDMNRMNESMEKYGQYKEHVQFAIHLEKKLIKSLPPPICNINFQIQTHQEENKNLHSKSCICRKHVNWKYFSLMLTTYMLKNISWLIHHKQSSNNPQNQKMSF